MASHRVFVANIAYDATETQLIDLFSQCGRVLSFRLAYDRDSGKPKGYGFCEFADADMSASAVRNLHNTDFKGRLIRVVIAEEKDGMGGDRGGGDRGNGDRRGGDREDRGGYDRDRDRGGRGGYDSRGPAPMSIDKKSDNNRRRGGSRERYDAPQPPPSMNNGPPPPPIQENKRLPPPPPSAPITMTAGPPSSIPSSSTAAIAAAPPSATAPPTAHTVETISKLVKALTREQLIEILSDMKKFAITSPEGAKQMLLDSPAVAQTLLQILILFGLVKPEDIVHMERGSAPIPRSGIVPAPLAPSIQNQLITNTQQPPLLPPTINPPPPVGVPMMMSPTTAYPPGPPPPPNVAYPPITHPATNMVAPPPPIAPFHGRPPPHTGYGPPPGVLMAPPMGIPPSGPPPPGPPLPPVHELAEKDRQVLQQVMNLSPAELAQLPPEIQQQVMAVKAQLGIR